MASTEKPSRIQGIGASEEDVPKFENNAIARATEDMEKAKAMAEKIQQDANLSSDSGLDRKLEYLLEVRVRTLEIQMDELRAAASPTASNQSISATLVGGIFNCPECGLRITSPALIATQGMKASGYYEHPFEDSPRLGGQKCRLIGRKFKSPIVVLEMAPAPAPKKVDVQETIGV